MYDSSLESPSSAYTQPNLGPATLRPQRNPFSNLRISRLAMRVTGLAVALIALIALASFAFSATGNKSKQDSSQPSANYAVTQLKTGTIASPQQLQIGQADTLVINGQLKVSKTLVLTPSAQPNSSTAVAGQIYYDQTSNEPYYYNGSSFVSLSPTATPEHITSLGGAAGILALGDGLQISGSTLGVASSLLQSVASQANSAKVTSLQGLTGAVSLVAGNGIALAGTTITNGGVVGLSSSSPAVTISHDASGNYSLAYGGVASLTAGTPNLTISNDGAGNYTIADNSAGSSGQVDLGPTTAQADASTNTSIHINKTASGNFLDFASSGASTFVVNQQGQIVTGTINYSQVQGAPTSTVTSLTGTANQIAVSAGTGAVTLSLPQNIATSSAPTFAGATLNGGLTATTASFSGNLSVTGSSSLTTGSGTVTLGSLGAGLVQSNASGVLSSGSLDRNSADFSGTLSLANGGTGASSFVNGGLVYGSNTSLLSTAAGTAGQLVVANSSNLPAFATLSGDASLNASGALTVQKLQNSPLAITTPTTGQVLQYNGSSFVNGLLTNSNLQAGSFNNITGTGALSSGSITTGFGSIATSNNISTTTVLQGNVVNATGSGAVLELNGTDVNAAGTLSNVAYLNQANVFSAATNTFAGSVVIASTAGLTLGNPGVASGALRLATSSNGQQVVFQTQPVNGGTGDATVLIPQLVGGTTDQVCLLTLANCTGGGAAIGSVGGTQNYLSKYNNNTGTQLSNSELFDDGTFVGINTTTNNGQLSVSAAGSATNLYLQGASSGANAVSVIKSGGSSGDLLDLESSTGTVLAKVDASGNLSAVNGVYSGTLNVSGASTFSSNLTQTGAGSLSTGTGAVSLNGNTSVTGTNSLTTGTGTVTLGSLGTGLVQSSNTGQLSSGALDRNSAVYLTNTLNVANGGTGAASFTAGGLIYGNGTNGLLATASGISGQLLVVNSSNLPVLATLSGDASLSASGALTVNALQTNPLAISGASSGQVLQYNGSSFVNSLITNSNLQTGSYATITGVGALTSGSIASGFGTIASTNSITTSSTLQGNIVNASGSGAAVELNGQNINSAGTLGNVAYLNQANTFSAANTFASGVTVGVANTTTGVVTLANNASSQVVLLQASAPSGGSNATVVIPSTTGTDQICLKTLANCVGAGGAVSTSGGTQYYVTHYTNAAATQIGNSSIYDNGSFVGLNTTTNSGQLSVVGSGSQTGFYVQGASSGSNAVALIKSGGSSGDLLDLESSTGTVLAKVDASGNLSAVNGVYSGTLNVSGNSTFGGSITQSGSGSLSSGTGAVSLNGNTSVTGSNSLTTGSGAVTLGSLGSGVVQSNASGLLSSGTLDRNSAVYLTGTLNVANGGTGSTSFTAGGLVYGNGAGSLQTSAAGTSGQLAVVNSSNLPAFVSLGGDASLTNTGALTVNKLQTNPLSISGVANGQVLQYNGSSFVNSLITNTNLQAGSFASITGVGALTSGSIASGFGSISTTNTITTSSTLQGNIVNASGSGAAVELNGQDINTAGTLGNVAYLNQSNSFTGASNTFSGAVSVQGAGGLTLGVPGTTVGSLDFANAGSGSRVVLLQSLGFSSAGGSNATVNLPALANGATDQICLLTLANCAGTGGSVATTAGTQNYITKYNNAAASQISNSEVYDNGNFVGVNSTTNNGQLSVVASGSQTGFYVQGASSGSNAVSVIEAGGSSGDLLDLESSTGTVLAKVDASGNLSAVNGVYSGTLNVSGASTFSNNVTQTGSGTFSTGSGAVSLNGNTSVSGSNTFSTGTGAVSLNGNTSVSGNLTQTGSGTFSTGSGAVSLNGAVTISGTNTLSVGTGSVNFGGSLGVGGLTTLSGGATISGAVAINTSGTASTAIGNSTGTFSVASSGVNISNAGAVSGVSTLSASGAITAATSSNTINGLVINAGALSSVASITTAGGYTQTGSSANTFSGATTFTAAGTALTVNNNASVSGTLSTGTLSVGNGGISDSGSLSVSGSSASSIAGQLNLTASGTALNVTNNATIGGGLSVTGSAGLSLGNSSNNGLLSFANGSNTATLTIAGPSSGSGTTTYSIPGIVAGTSDTICLHNLGNCGASASTVTTSTAGTTNTLAKFTAGNTIANSSITDDGTTVTVGALLSAATISTSTIQSSGALSITPGGNLTIGATARTLALQGNASSTISASNSGNTTTVGFVTPTANNSINFPNASGTVCLQSSSSCGFAVSGSGVTSLNGAAGAVTIGNTSTAGSAITINDASTTQKGIAQFNSSDFTASSGSIDTVQGITTTSAVQFGSLTLGTGNLTLSSSGVVNTNNLATVSGGISFDAGTGTMTFKTDSGNESFVFPTYGGQGQVICTSGISCATGGGSAVILEPSSVQSATANKDAIFINKASGSGDLLHLQAAGSDALVIDNSGNTTINGSTTVASLTATGTITANTITPTTALTIGSTAQQFTVQGTTAGSSISFTDSGYQASLASGRAPSTGAPTGSVSYELENDNSISPGTYFVCTTSGNCSGVGGSVTSSGGSANQLAKFTASGNIANSSISDTGALVTVANNLVVGNATSGQITIGVAGSSTGSLVFTNATNSNTITLSQAGAPSANTTVKLPNASGTVAVSATGPISLDPLTGQISCASCLTSGGGGGSAGVASLDALTGALTLNNSTGSGTAITINDASTTQKGIAQFNATNFSASSGTINTVQDIASSASPTFTNLTLQGSSGLLVGSSSNVGQLAFKDGTADGYTAAFSPVTLTANRTIVIPDNSGTVAVAATGNLALSAAGIVSISNSPSFSTSVTTPSLLSSGTLSITSGGQLSIGSTVQTLSLLGNGSTTLAATAGSYTSTVGFTSPTANRTINFPDASGTVCLQNSSSCGFVTSGSVVTSLNGLTGALSVANASASGSTVTINQASTTQLGLAQFNGTNFSVSSGVVNTIQDITTSASPTFAGLTLGGSGLTDNGTATFNGNTSITGTNSFTVGSGATALGGTFGVAGLTTLSGGLGVAGTSDLEGATTINTTSTASTTIGNASGTFAVSSSAFKVTTTGAISGVSTLGLSGAISGATAGNTINGLIINSGALSGITGYSQTSGNFAQSGTGSFSTGSGAVSLNGATSVSGSNTLSVGSGATSLGGTLGVTGAGTITGGLNVGTSNQFQVSNSGVVSGGTYNGQTLGATSSLTGTLSVQGTSVSIGTSGTQGSLILNDGNGASNKTGSLITSATLGQNTTYTLPDPGVASATICLSTGNCAGSGGGVTTSGGTQNYLTKYSNAGANQLSNSQLFDNGSFVGINTTTNSGQLSIVTSGSQSGLFVQGAATGSTAASIIQSGGGSGDLLDLDNSSGTPLAKIDASGNLTAVGGSFSGNIAQTGATTLSTGTGSVSLNGNTSLAGSKTFTTGSGAVTLGSLGIGIVQSSAAGLLSSGAVDRNSATYFSNALTVANGGTGATSLTANSVLLGNGSGAIQSASGTSGQLLLANGSGVPAFTTISGDVTISGTGVTTIGSGVVTGAKIANATVANSNLVNSSITVTSGTNITAGASVALGGTLSVAVINNPSFSGLVTASASGTGLAVTGAPSASSTTSLIQIGSTITGGNNAANGGTYLGLNEPSSGAGSAADFANFEVGGASKLKVDATGALTLAAGITAATSGNTLNGLIVNSGAISGITGYSQTAGNFAQSSTGTFSTGTGAVSLNGATTVSTNLSVQGSGGLSLGVAGTTTGNLYLSNAGNASQQTVVQALSNSGSGTVTYQLPGGTGGQTYQLCSTSGNCAGAGLGVTATGSNANYIAKFSAAQNITNSLLYDNGAGVSVGGTSPAGLFNVGSSNQFQVDSSGNVTGGGYNGQTISSAASFTGTVATASNVTVGGSLTVATGETITAGGAAITGNSSLSGNLNITNGALSVNASIAGTYALSNITAANTNTSATANIVAGQLINLSGSANSHGGNTNVGLSLANVTPVSGNTFSALYAGTGYDSLLNYSGTSIISGTGVLQSAGLAGSYTSALTFSNVGNSFYGSGANLSALNGTAITSGTVGVGVGGTGAGSFATNGVLYGNGSGALQASTAGTGGQVLLANAGGTPTFTSLSGDVTVNATGVTTIGAGVVTGAKIANATVANTNLVNSSITVTSGSNISASASVALGGTLSVAVINNPSFSGLITASAAGTGLAVTGTVSNSAANSLVQLGSAISGGNAVANGGTYLGLNEPSSGAGSAADYLNFQTAGTSKLRVDNSGDVTAAGTLSLGGSITAATSGNTINGLIVNSGALSGITGYSQTSGNFAQTGTGTFSTGSGTVSLNGATTDSSTLTVQGATTTIGTAAVQGSLILNSGNAKTATLTGLATLGQNTTYTLPDPSSTTATICISTGNCSGAGTGVTASTPGTANYLAKFTASQAIANSVLYDNGTGVSIGSTTVTGLLNVGTSAQFQVSSSGAVTSGLINGQTISSAASLTGSLAVAGATTVSTTLGVSGLASLSGGLTATGANVNLNSSSNYATNINTGTSNGAINLGNSAAGAISLQSGSTLGITSTNFSLTTAGVLTATGLLAPSLDTASAASLVIGGSNATSIALNNANVITNQSTIALFNVTPTTVNAFGAATTINLGASTGTTTINTPTLQLGATGGTGFVGFTGNTSGVTGFHSVTSAVASATTGAVSLRSGNATGTTANSGAVVISTGSATAAAGNINIDTGAGASGTPTINIGSNTATPGTIVASTNTRQINIGNTASNTGVAIQGGSGAVTINNTTSSTGTIGIGNSAAGAITLQSGSTLGITSTNFSVTTAGALTAGTYNGQTISSAASFTGTLAVAGLTTATSGLATNSIDTIASGGTLAIGQTNATGGINLYQNTTLQGQSLTLNYTANNSAIFAINNSGGTIFNVDTTNNRVTIGNVGSCFGAASGHACINLNVSSGSATSVNTNSSVTVSGTSSGATADANLIELKDTSGNANTLQGLVVDGSNTTTSDTFNGVVVTSKGTTQAGNLLQLTSGVTNEFQVTNAGAVTANGGSTLTTGSGVALVVQGSGTSDITDIKSSGSSIVAKFDNNGNLYGPSIDSLGTSLAIGNTNATTINLGSTAVARAINIGTGAAAQTLFVGSTNTSSAATLQAGTSSVALTNTGTTVTGALTATGAITSGTSSVAGSLILQSASSGRTLTFNTTNLATAVSLSVPATASGADTFCLYNAQNCVGLGGSITTADTGTGNQYYLQRNNNTAGTQLTNSELYDNGFIGVNTTTNLGQLSVVASGTQGALNLQGPTSGGTAVATFKGNGSTGDLLDLYNGITLQGSLSSTGNLFVNTALSVPTIDSPASNGTLNLGTNTAATTAINIGSSNVGSIFLTTTGGSNYIAVTGLLSERGNIQYTANGGAGRTIGVATPTSTSAGDALTISAGSGFGTSQNGGNLVLQAGSNTGSGIDGGVLVKNSSTTGSTSAFSVQDASGNTALNVNTTAEADLITNGNFETATTGWTVSDGSTALTQSNYVYSYDGQHAGQIVTSGGSQSATSGVYYSFSSKPAAGTYTLSFFVAKNNGTFTTLGAGYNQATGTFSQANNVSCTLNSTNVKINYSQVYCTFTTTSPLNSIYIQQGDTVARTFFIDDVTLISGSVPTVNANDSIELGTVDSPLHLAASNDSTDAFDLQGYSSTSSSNLCTATCNTLRVDTFDDNVSIGYALGTLPTTLDQLDVSGTIGATTALSAPQLYSTSGTLNIGYTGAANSISIGSSTAGAQNINIGTGSSTSTQSVVIGSISSSSTTFLQGGNLRESLNNSTTNTIGFTGLTSAYDSAAGTGTDLVASLNEALTTVGNWTASGSGASASAVHTSGSATATALTPSITSSLTVGEVVTVTYTISSRTGGSVAFSIGGVNGTSRSTNGTFKQTVTLTSTANLTFVPGSSFAGTISSITVVPAGTVLPVLTVYASDGTATLEVRNGGDGNYDTFIGLSSGQNNSLGQYDTGNGTYALQNNTTGSYNNGNGYNALQANTTGSYNVATGPQSLQNNTIGSSNTATGTSSLSLNTIGSYNTAYGTNTLTFASGATAAANYSSAFGYNAGNIDPDGFFTVPGVQNATAIGADAEVQSNNNLILGSVGTAGTTNVGIGTTQALNILSVESVAYSAGQASQSGNTVTGTGTTFTSAMVGDQITFGQSGSGTGNYTPEIITGFTNTSTITVSQNQTIALVNYRIHNPGLQVTSTGTVCVAITSCTRTLGVNGTIGATGVVNGSSFSSTSGDDVDENITTDGSANAYDVVMADPTNTEQVTQATAQGASSIVGVIGDGTAGLILSSAHYNSSVGMDDATPANVKPLALTGRVLVHVTNENGAISPGDHLTISPTTPGYATKAIAPGMSIGTALGSFNAASGTVLILINVGYYAGPTQTDYVQNGGDATLNNLTVNGALDAADINTGGLANIGTLQVTGSASIGGDLTIGGGLTVAGLTSVQDLQISGHIITAGNTPTVSLLDAAGSAGASVAVTGNDTSGTITVTVGQASAAASGNTPAITGPSIGDLLKLTFNKLYGKTPRVIITGNDANSAKLLVFPDATSAGSFNLSISNQPTAATTYSFNYFSLE